MYRFAALATVFASLCAGPSSAGEPTQPVTPPELQVALIRPALPLAPELAEPVALQPEVADPRPAEQPSLSARLAMAPKILVKVDISDQTMRVVVEGEERFTWKVSTAGKGYRTPTGVWTPYRMHTMWHSKKYDNAPMPHSIFFTGGYAIHATPHVKRLGRPASHGCVRLHPDNAKELFALAKQYGKANMRVIVQN